MFSTPGFAGAPRGKGGVNDRSAPRETIRWQERPVSKAVQSALAAPDGVSPGEPAATRPARRSPEPFEALYRDQSPRLLRALARRTTSREEAGDLVQEIFCRIARLGTARLRELERPHAYLNRMAGNLLHDRARRQARQGPPIDGADLDLFAGPDQQRLLEARDMLERVEAAMLRLRPKTREIFMAHRIEGLSYAEIAQRTGLSVKGVEKQMSKAIAALDRLLERTR